MVSDSIPAMDPLRSRIITISVCFIFSLSSAF
jgi:hypothetical protein